MYQLYVFKCFLLIQGVPLLIYPEIFFMRVEPCRASQVGQVGNFLNVYQQLTEDSGSLG